jgi:hypothetical protein
MLQQAIQSRSVLVPFVQLYGLDIWGSEGFKTLGRDPRYIEMVNSLNFPTVGN